MKHSGAVMLGVWLTLIVAALVFGGVQLGRTLEREQPAAKCVVPAGQERGPQAGG
jgi:hypothetical protein